MHTETPVWVSLLPFFVFMGLMVFPASRILRKAGFSPWWALGMLVPLGIFVGLWIFAFSRWPTLEPKYYEGVFGDPRDDNRA